MISDDTCRYCTDPHRRQRGQVTIEFFLALLIVLIGVSALYQALFFERDVFNRLNYLRFAAMNLVHANQENTTRTYSHVDSEFQRLADVTPYEIPMQAADTDMRYGPKALDVRYGTKYRDPVSWVHNRWVIDGMLTTAHAEDTKDLFQQVNFRTQQFPVPCGSVLVTGGFMTFMQCGFVDP